MSSLYLNEETEHFTTNLENHITSNELIEMPENDISNNEFFKKYEAYEKEITEDFIKRYSSTESELRETIAYLIEQGLAPIIIKRSSAKLFLPLSA